MLGEIPLEGEPLLTFRTFIGLLPSVLHHVGHHIALLSKAHPALFASEGLFVRVDHLVGFEVALGGELGGALVTCKWFLIGVDLKRVKE